MNLVAPNLGANGGVFSDAVLFQSFIANVDGIKFYEGHLHLRSVMRVLFERELSNPHDSNGILVKLVLPTGLCGVYERTTTHIAISIDLC